MLVTCINDKTNGKNRILETGKIYEASIDESKPNCFKIVFTREELDRKKISKKMPLAKYFKKDRFIVVE